MKRKIKPFIVFILLQNFKNAEAILSPLILPSPFSQGFCSNKRFKQQ
jgi:hypothetical protein